MFLSDNIPDEPDTSIWTDTKFPTIRGELLGTEVSKITKLIRIDPNGNNIRTI